MKKPTIFTEPQLSAMFGPCVYIFWEESQCLYVGSSKQGVIRAFNPRHHIRIDYKPHITRIEIYWCKDSKEARKLEIELIHVLDPKLNMLVLIDMDARRKSLRKAAKTLNIDVNDLLKIVNQ